MLESSFSNSAFSVEIDEGIAVVRIDDPAASVNTLSRRTLDELGSVLDSLQTSRGITGAYFISLKPHSFVVGADIAMFDELDASSAAELSRAGQSLLHRVRRLPFPTVAAINGPAMGGGLEFALACTYRVLTTASSSKLALPEVRLGLCPGLGGTQYLPRLVGLREGLPLLLTGKNVYPSRARRIGLVDTVCPPALLARTARDLLRRRPDPQRLSFADRMLTRGPARTMLLKAASQRTQLETHGNYPAPEAILACVDRGFSEGLAAGLAAEADAFGRLLETPQSRALVSLFRAQRAGEKDHSAGELDRPRIGILGAGLMGSGIAAVSVEGGSDVVVVDQTIELASGAVHHVWRKSAKDHRRGIISRFELDARSARVRAVDDYDALKTCDAIIEAVPENVDLKRTVLRQVESIVADDAVIATNTSAIPLSELRSSLSKPERFLGMHYFSPVEKMPLLEIVRHDHTSGDALVRARQIGHLQGKTVIVVNDGPGFYTTRILAAYLNEALLIFEQGGSIVSIDRAVKRFGFPMGPFELLDLVGIDTAAGITSVLGARFEKQGVPISRVTDRLAEVKWVGRKSGLGFYAYGEPGAKPGADRESAIRPLVDAAPAVRVDLESVVDRLILTMVNEAVRTLEEGILMSVRDGDVGAVFGLGFPPYTGGPFRYVDQRTPQAIVLALRRMAIAHGPRFEPTALLQAHAQDNRPFHNSRTDTAT